MFKVNIVTICYLFRVIREENESFYDNIILQSIRNNQEIPICWIENTLETPLTRSAPYLPSENIVSTSESMENVLPVSVDNAVHVLPVSVDNSLQN